MLYPFGEQLRLWINKAMWRPALHLSATVRPLPLLFGFLAFYVLAAVGQSFEVYYDLLEPPMLLGQWIHIGFAAGALGLLSAALFFSYNLLTTERIGDIYSSQNISETEYQRLEAVQDWIALVLAMLPWIGVATGSFLAANQAISNQDLILGIGRRFDATADELGLIAARLRVAGLLAALLGLALVSSFRSTRESWGVRRTAIGMVALVTGVQILAPLFLPVLFVSLDRFFGPLAMLAFTIATAFGFVLLVTWLARPIQFPVLQVVLAIAVATVFFEAPVGLVAWAALGVLGMLALAGLFSNRWSLAGLLIVLCLLAFSVAHEPGGYDVGVSKGEGAVASGVGDRFGDWLSAREDELRTYQQAGKAYPVFVLAAQGGGIYAASEVETFLTRMQRGCDSFPQHIFAISAVSGGAVGAAMFNSGLPNERLSPAGCRSSPPNDAPSPASQAIGGDHLSPLLGSILAGVLGIRKDRSEALEQSLQQAASASPQMTTALATPCCQWDPAKPAPALVLDTTWVETGFRVAFAPFDLDGMHDGTLFSFDDKKILGHRPSQFSLAGAAVASARFPGFLPALGLLWSHEGFWNVRRWNFVDGGYADPSGAATALDLYKALAAAEGEALAKLPPDARPKLELRLVILTSAESPIDPKSLRGSFGSDTIAPGVAMLKVRESQAHQSVVRAADEISEGSNPRPDHTAAWTVATIELDVSRFNLPLAWKLSGVTRSVISDLMGAPGSCQRQVHLKADLPPSLDSDLPLALDRIRHNSCIMHDMVELLSLSAR